MWTNQSSYTQHAEVTNGANMLGKKTWYYPVYMKIHIPFNLATLSLDLYLEKLRYISPGDMHKNVYTSTLCDSRVLETVQISINNKMNKYIVE